MMPNNPESFLAPVIRKALKYPTFFSESDKKFVIALLQLLHETWDDFGEMAHLFLATSMISSDKTAANIAAEIWVKATNAKKIDHVLLGKIIGIHQRIEFAPFKRFTDLFLQSMFKISPLHNQSAQIILENILAELPEEPVKNLKKLLEVYSELLNLNAAKLTDSRVQKKLECWQKNTGLSKLAKVSVSTFLTFCQFRRFKIRQQGNTCFLRGQFSNPIFLFCVVNLSTLNQTPEQLARNNICKDIT